MGTSLIPLVSAGVPLRNQAEFEQYSKVITNPNSLQSELEGALEGLENLINRQLGGSGEQKPEMGQQEAPENEPMINVIPPGGGRPRQIPRSQVNAAVVAGGRVTQ